MDGVTSRLITRGVCVVYSRAAKQGNKRMTATQVQLGDYVTFAAHLPFITVVNNTARLSNARRTCPDDCSH